jgi:branched-chain amino acid transport system ATP-binding protein
MSAPMLQVQDLCAWYGRAQVLFDVSLSVAPGEVVALLGRNGAGKSTTMKAILGMVSRRAQVLDFNGQDIRALPAHRIARMGLGWVPEDRRIFTDLSVLENLEVGRQSPRAGAPQWTVSSLFDLFPNLAQMPDRLGGRMSGGEQQMLTVARTLMGQPRVVLLDEPSEGVAPVIVAQMARSINEMKRQGLTVVLSEQNLSFAAQVSDRAYVLEKGQMRFEGPMARLTSDAALRHEWLGV